MKNIQNFLILIFKNILQFFTLITCLSATMADGIPQNWQTYANTRFQYQICYPAFLLKPQPEPDSGDGRRFLGNNGVELAVFGRVRFDDLTLADNVKMESTDLAGSVGKITYQVMHKNWAIVSGYDGKKNIFYSKILKRSDYYIIFDIKYPKKESALYDKISATLSNCIK